MTLSNSFPDKQYYTIGEVSKYCGLEAHTLRYWQKEFDTLEPVTRNGRRCYQKADIQLIIKIKDLLHDQKYSIRGARDFLKNELKNRDVNAASSPIINTEVDKEVIQQLDTSIKRLKNLL